MILMSAVMSSRRKAQRRKRRMWVHPYWRNNVENHSPYMISEQLLAHPEKFQQMYKMKIETFQKLLRIMHDHLQPEDTNYRRAVPAQERLLIFLRYLATGQTFSSLSLEFYRGVSTIATIVKDTAKKLWSLLQPTYMAMPTEDAWLKIAGRFAELWNVPHCVGCIDGKHMRIKKPKKSGSQYINYHGYFSIVLMACSDADGFFICISVGDFGSNSDGRAITSCGFYDLVEKNILNIPSPRPLPNKPQENFPFYFIGDQAFPLRPYLMRPYPRKRSNNDSTIFNYRMSRARKSVECSFGMLANKFRLFLTEIECEPDKCADIVKAACVLHNFIKLHDGVMSIPSYDQDIDTAYRHFQSLQHALPARQMNTAKELRDRLRAYFLMKGNALPWQNNVLTTAEIQN